MIKIIKNEYLTANKEWNSEDGEFKYSIHLNSNFGRPVTLSSKIEKINSSFVNKIHLTYKDALVLNNNLTQLLKQTKNG